MRRPCGRRAERRGRVVPARRARPRSAVVSRSSRSTRAVRVGGQRRRAASGSGRPARDGGLVEEVAVVLEQRRAGRPAARRRRAARSNWRCRRSTGTVRHVEARQLERRPTAAFWSANITWKSGCVAEVSRSGCQLLDQPLERQVLVGVGGQRAVADLRAAARRTLGRPARSARSTRVLTKKPISARARCGRGWRPACRPATSSWPRVAVEQAWKAASSAMNSGGALAGERVDGGRELGVELEARGCRRGSAATGGRGPVGGQVEQVGRAGELARASRSSSRFERVAAAASSRCQTAKSAYWSSAARPAPAPRRGGRRRRARPGPHGAPDPTSRRRRCGGWRGTARARSSASRNRQARSTGAEVSESGARPRRRARAPARRAAARVRPGEVGHAGRRPARAAGRSGPAGRGRTGTSCAGPRGGGPAPSRARPSAATSSGPRRRTRRRWCRRAARDRAGPGTRAAPARTTAAVRSVVLTRHLRCLRPGAIRQASPARRP